MRMSARRGAADQCPTCAVWQAPDPARLIGAGGRRPARRAGHRRMSAHGHSTTMFWARASSWKVASSRSMKARNASGVVCCGISRKLAL